MHIKDKRPLNEVNQAHGYWEVYYPNGQLHFKGLFVNSDVIGPYESYSEDGSLTLKCIFLNRIIYGFCEHLQHKFYYAH
jgi:antitoxin component YwqK of YwqJK toxin-antitoxin module